MLRSPGVGVWAGALAIVALGTAIYGSTLDFPFTFDDQKNITSNAGIRLGDGGGVGALRLWSPTRRPVSNLSFALNHGWSGYEESGYRATNVAIHVWVSLLVSLLTYLVLGRVELLGGQGGFPLGAGVRVGLSLWSGALFVSHPLGTQSVVYVVQRMTSLSTLFYVAGLCSWIASGSRSGGGRLGLRFLACVLGLLSLGSKEIGATFPLAVWMWEWGVERGGSRSFVVRSLPWGLGLLGVGCLLLWSYSSGDPLGDYTRKPFTLWERLWTEPRVWWRYVGLVLAPLPGRLSVIHGVEMSSGAFTPWTTWVSWLGWVLALVTSWKLSGRDRLWSALIGWWLLQQLVEGTFLPLEPMYEHRTYLALVGVAVVAPWGCRRGWQALGLGGAWGAGVGAAVVLALAFAAHQRAQVWGDTTELWADAVAKAPFHGTTHANHGVALIRQERFDEARAALARAASHDPYNYAAYQNLGAIEVGLGRFDAAEPHFRAALEIEPFDALSLAGLGVIAMERGDPRAAIELHERSLAIAPDPRVRANLGQIYLRTGDADAARRELLRSLSVDGRQPIALRALGQVWLELGAFEQAVAALEHALLLEPRWQRDPAVVELLAAAYRGAGRDDLAEALRRASGLGDGTR